jgi:O-antigen/teichoic acid export membrane protein
MRRLINRIMQSIPQGLGPLALSNLASQFCTLLAMPFLLRWCGPAEIGILQIYVSLVTMTALVSCLRYDYALLQPPEARDAELLGGLACLAAIICGLLVLVILPIAARGFGTAGWLALSDLAIPIGFAVAGTGAASAATQWLVRQGEFRILARTRLAQSVTTVILQLGGAHAALGGAGLILGDVVGRLVGAAMLLSATPLLRHLPHGRKTLAEGLSLGRRFDRFPLVATPSAIVSALGMSLPAFLLERYCGPAVLGLYSLIERVMGVPTLLLGQPLSQTFTHRLQRAVVEAGGSPASVIRRTAKVAALAGLPAFGILVLAGAPLFRLVFGSAWEEAGRLAQWLAPVYFLAYICWPVMPTLFVLDRLRTQIGWDVGRTAALAGMAVPLGSMRLDPVAAIAAFSSIMSLFALLHYWLCLRAVGSREVGEEYA